MKKDINSIVISSNDSIKKAVNVITETGFRCALVVDEKSLLAGIITDGDIRKQILKEANLNLSVKVIMNTRPIILKEGYSLEEAKEVMIKNGITLIPIVDQHNRVVDYLHLPDIILELERNGGLKRNSKKAQEIKKVLVIGGAGYIGSILVRRLIDAGYKVRVMDILLYGDESIKNLYQNANFEFMRGDCRNMQDVIRALDGIDAVVHLGEIVGDSACSLNPDFTIEVNYMATKTLAEACCYHGIQRFIFSSSCSVYGSNDAELDEKSELNPVSLYARCKVESEDAILSIKDDYFSPVVLRLATVYGFSYRPRFDLVVNLLAAKAIKEKKIEIFGGDQWRPFVSIEDVADACLLSLQAEDRIVNRKVFNVGSNEQNYQLQEIGDFIKSVIPNTVIELKKDITDRRNYKVVFDKIYNTLGFRCKRQILDGIKNVKEHILNTADININDAAFNNYRMFIGSEDR